MHMELSIRHEDGSPVPHGEVGEVWIKADTNMAGYLNLPQQTAEAFSGKWLKTHDMGRLDEEGYLYLTDRKNFLIITGGANVYPSVVESALSEHPAVLEVAVVGAVHPEWGEAVVAMVVLHPGKMTTAENLLTFSHGRLAKWEVPKFIEIVTDLPKGPTGKVLKRQLLDRYRTQPGLLPWNGTSETRG